jgi:hypothetical protein
VKKIILAIISILSFCAAQAQSFSWSGGTFDVYGPYDGPNIHGEVLVTNVSGQPLDLVCRISSAEMTTGHTKWFCFGPNCYPPNVTVSLTTTLNAGDSALLLAYCAPNDSEGVSTIHYQIFDINGNSDTLSFTFNYSFNFAGIGEISSSKYFLSANPNPAAYMTSVTCHRTPEKNARLVLRNLSGTTVKEIRFGENDETVLLPIDDLTNGVYVYTLYIDGSPAASKKMVVAR